MDETERERIRLCDRILSALELSLEQKDVKISETLTRALEQSMTRNAGGGEFIERRDYPPEIERAMDNFFNLRDQQNSV